LEQIPNCNIEFFNDGLNCCGAGGMQLLTPQTVNLQLLERKCAYIQDTMPDVIVSPNIGCSLHLQTGLEQAGLAVEVIHPVTFIYRQLVIG
jgi:glycolate oxidase iron-sulfur subunit